MNQFQIASIDARERELHGLGTYHLSGDYAESAHTAPLREGAIVREIIFRPSDALLPDVPVCTVHNNRETAEAILGFLNQRAPRATGDQV